MLALNAHLVYQGGWKRGLGELQLTNTTSHHIWVRTMFPGLLPGALPRTPVSQIPAVTSCTAGDTEFKVTKLVPLKHRNSSRWLQDPPACQEVVHRHSVAEQLDDDDDDIGVSVSQWRHVISIVVVVSCYVIKLFIFHPPMRHGIIQLTVVNTVREVHDHRYNVYTAVASTHHQLVYTPHATFSRPTQRIKT